MNQKLMEEFVNTNHQIKNLVEKKECINYDTKVVPKLQFFALKYISKNPRTTVGQLAKELTMSSGAIAQLIERLVDKQWIIKEVDNEDKRIYHLSLSALGEEEILKMKEFFHKRVLSIISLIPEEDLKQILDIERRLLEKLKKENLVC